MLINSSRAKGKCPICGAPNCTCGGPSTVIPVDERTTLVTAERASARYPVAPGVYVRLSDAEAERRGLKKARGEGANKMRTPQRDK
jgi:hypothetical protein